jgi:uncharacterized membrane protein
MQYYIWILVNAIFIIGTTLYIWMVHPQDSKVIQSGLLIAQASVLLFLVNINMHFIFKIIKKSNRRQVRVMLAKFSRKMMKWHVPFAIVGTALILIHGGIMIIKLGPVIGLFHYKMITGYLAVICLIVTLIGGYRRSRKSSGFRRKFHLAAAMIFGSMFVIHLNQFHKA